MVSTETKELLLSSYSIAQSLIKEFNLTANDKDKIDSKIKDKNVKKALYEILEIKNN